MKFTEQKLEYPMPHPSLIAHRRRIRLKGYDYSQAGMYFVTINLNNTI